MRDITKGNWVRIDSQERFDQELKWGESKLGEFTYVGFYYLLQYENRFKRLVLELLTVEEARNELIELKMDIENQILDAERLAYA